MPSPLGFSVFNSPSYWGCMFLSPKVFSKKPDDVFHPNSILLSSDFKDNGRKQINK